MKVEELTEEQKRMLAKMPQSKAYQWLLGQGFRRHVASRLAVELKR